MMKIRRTQRPQRPQRKVFSEACARVALVINRRKISFAVLAAFAFFVVGCNRGGDTTTSTAKPRVALVLKTLNSPFFNDMQRGAQEAATRLNVDLVVQAAEREVDVERQMQIVENLLQTNIKALCLTPSGSKEIVPAVVKANRAGIPVIIVDTKLDPAAAQQAGAKVLSFLGSDNYEGGRIAGPLIRGESHGPARIALLEGIPGHDTAEHQLHRLPHGLPAPPGITT